MLVAKFADHLPLYWQAIIYAREGVDVDRALLASWVGAASAMLRPFVDAIRRHVLTASKLHAGDTPIPVLAADNGRTKTARLWTYVRDDRPAGDTTPPAVWFAYTPDCKGIHPQTHFAKFEGLLQADAYAGFNALLLEIVSIHWFSAVSSHVHVRSARLLRLDVSRWLTQEIQVLPSSIQEFGVR